MMPSHSMDLPVPRGTSMLMLDGKFTSYGTKTELHMCPVSITWSKYVSMSSSCFSPDGKFTFAFQSGHQPTLNYVFSAGLLVKLNTVVFILIWSLTYVLNLYSQGLNTQDKNAKYRIAIKIKMQITALGLCSVEDTSFKLSWLMAQF